MDTKARNEAKAAELVIAAIAGLQDGQGSTLSKITKFITSRYEVDEKDIKQPVRTALRRGVTFGFLEKQGVVYRLSPNYDISRPRPRKPSKPVKRAGKRKPSAYNRKRSSSRNRRSTQK